MKQHKHSYDLTRFDKFKIQIYHFLARFFDDKEVITKQKQSSYYLWLLCPLCGGKLVHDYFFHSKCQDCDYKFDFNPIEERIAEHEGKVYIDTQIKPKEIEHEE